MDNSHNIIEGRFSLNGGYNVVSNTGSGSINDNSGNQAVLNIDQLVPIPTPVVIYPVYGLGDLLK